MVTSPRLWSMRRGKASLSSPGCSKRTRSRRGSKGRLLNSWSHIVTWIGTGWLGRDQLVIDHLHCKPYLLMTPQGAARRAIGKGGVILPHLPQPLLHLQAAHRQGGRDDEAALRGLLHYYFWNKNDGLIPKLPWGSNPAPVAAKSTARVSPSLPGPGQPFPGQGGGGNLGSPGPGLPYPGQGAWWDWIHHSSPKVLCLLRRNTSGTHQGYEGLEVDRKSIRPVGSRWNGLSPEVTGLQSVRTAWRTGFNAVSLRGNSSLRCSPLECAAPTSVHSSTPCSTETALTKIVRSKVSRGVSTRTPGSQQMKLTRGCGS